MVCRVDACVFGGDWADNIVVLVDTFLCCVTD